MLRQLASGLCFAAAALCALLYLLMRPGTVDLVVGDSSVSVAASHFGYLALGLLVVGAVLAAFGRRSA